MFHRRPFYRKEDIAKIKDAADLLDVISDHVELKKSGASYVGICPHCRAKKFTVTPSKGIFKCFSGCDKSGKDAIAFLTDVIGKDFKDALEYLHDRYQVDLDTAELPIHTVEGYLGPGYGQADADVFVTIAELARLEGLFLDPVYTGKAFHGMVSELLKAEQGLNSAMPAARSVVFIHTGGLFGLFPQKQGFGF